MRDGIDLYSLWGVDERSVSPTWLYRYYDAQGGCLYIGISNQIEQRNYKHRRAPWYRNDAFLFVEVYPVRHLAEAAEDYAICNEWPQENAKARQPPEIGKMRAPWFFDETNGLLVGKERHWVDSNTFHLPETNVPEWLSEPEPIIPIFRQHIHLLASLGKSSI